MVIDYSKREVSINGERIGLSRKEFDIVELLSANAGQVFDRERIYELVWGLDSDGNSDTVMEHIRKYETSLLPCRVTAILKQFGGWATNGMDKKHEPEKVLVFSDVREPIAGSDPLRCRLLGLHKIKRGT